jgi:AcrR family transcriptional regulator
MTDSPTLGRRERKKAATRAGILDAAVQLFLERGFDAVTVREIADKADVTPRTVFMHFPQKEALLFGDEDEQHKRLVEAVRDRAPRTTVSAALKLHYLAEISEMSSSPRRAPDPEATIDAGFRLLDDGWDRYCSELGRPPM